MQRTSWKTQDQQGSIITFEPIEVVFSWSLSMWHWLWNIIGLVKCIQIQDHNKLRTFVRIFFCMFSLLHKVAITKHPNQKNREICMVS